MWNIDALELRPVAYDFTDAGVGRFNGHALVAGDTVLINMVEAFECEPDGCAQVMICTTCGTVHCEPGGWIAPRRVDDAVVWVPCFVRMKEDDGRAEYRPPTYFGDRGVPLFRAAAAEALLHLVPKLGATLRDLSAAEAVSVMQFEAPARVLGTPGNSIVIRRDLVVAASEGDVASHLDQLDALLTAARVASAPIELATARPLELYLDVRGVPMWRPLAVDTRGQALLALDPLGAFAFADA